MLLSALQQTLSDHSLRNVRFVLPTGGAVPIHAHVTEVARVEKRFIDCGGTFRTETLCRMQVWLADDTEHRLSAAKLLGILGKASKVLETADMEVEVEYEAPFISQFPIESVGTDGALLVLRLGLRRTACLAGDRCLAPTLNRSAYLKPLPSFGSTKLR